MQRLYFIRHARELGFDMDDIRRLLALSEHPTTLCNAAEEIARHHLEQVETKIARLTLIRTELKHRIEACDGRSAADCGTLKAIAHELPSQKRRSRSVG